MTLTLYGYENNPRTRIARMVAAARGIRLNLVEVVPRKNINRDLLLARFPRSAGKIPALEVEGEGEVENVRLTEVLAISVYLAKTGAGASAATAATAASRVGLLGDGSVQQEAEVLSWVSWANQELLVTLARWFLPLIPGFSSPAPYDHAAIEAGKAASLTMLDCLETALSGGTSAYLVGDSPTLADIFVAVVVSRGLEWVLGAPWRAQHPNCMRHFDLITKWEPVREIVPEFALIESETPNVNPYAG